MRFIFYTKDGKTRELTPEEVLEHMTPYQVSEAIEAKKEDPGEEVSYMTVGGFIILEI